MIGGGAMAIFDFDNVFGDDYLHFYGPDLTAERNAREAEAIWQMLSLQAGQTVLDIGCGHGRIANQLARAWCPRHRHRCQCTLA